MIEDLYNKAVIIDNDEDFINFQHFMFSLGFNWMTTGNKIQELINSDLITIVREITHPTFGVNYSKNVILFDNGNRYVTEKISYKCLMRKIKLKKL